jgi:hypothetical protein
VETDLIHEPISHEQGGKYALASGSPSTENLEKSDSLSSEGISKFGSLSGKGIDLFIW